MNVSSKRLGMIGRLGREQNCGKHSAKLGKGQAIVVIPDLIRDPDNSPASRRRGCRVGVRHDTLCYPSCMPELSKDPKHVAIDILSRRDNSVREVQQKLKKKGVA